MAQTPSRSFIREGAFARMEHFRGDLAAMDSIFSLALVVNDFNVGDALLSATTGCFDHKTIYVKLPFFNMPVPLTFESDSDFQTRYNHLPAHLFTDTPPEGDRDKLQHFFGSAFIAWTTHSHSLATAIGDAIEILEPPLIVGGDNDPRDKRANRSGAAFALLLQTYPALPPSAVLKLVR